MPERKTNRHAARARVCAFAFDRRTHLGLPPINRFKTALLGTPSVGTHSTRAGRAAGAGGHTPAAAAAAAAPAAPAVAATTASWDTVALPLHRTRNSRRGPAAASPLVPAPPPPLAPAGPAAELLMRTSRMAPSRPECSGGTGLGAATGAAPREVPERLARLMPGVCFSTERRCAFGLSAAAAAPAAGVPQPLPLPPLSWLPALARTGDAGTRAPEARLVANLEMKQQQRQRQPPWGIVKMFVA